MAGVTGVMGPGPAHSSPGPAMPTPRARPLPCPGPALTAIAVAPQVARVNQEVAVEVELPEVAEERPGGSRRGQGAWSQLGGGVTG